MTAQLPFGRKSERPLPPGPRLCALLSASGTGPGSSALSAPTLYERSLDWRVGSFQVSMLEIDLGISLYQRRLIRLDEPDLRCVCTEQSGARIA
jgi:hypothetical protein